MFTLINLFVYAFIHVLGKPVLCTLAARISLHPNQLLQPLQQARNRKVVMTR